MIALGLALVVSLLMHSLFPGGLQSIDERSGDLLWRAFPSKTQEHRVIVVDIDEASLAEFGPWPWPRERLASLSAKLAALGAGPQIYDIVLPDARPGDELLAAEISRHPVVLSQIFFLAQEEPATAGKLQGALDTPACDGPLPQARGYIGNAPSLNASAGHISPRIDQDGAVRRMPALVCHDGRAYPALGLAALLKAAAAAPALTLSPGAGWLAPAYRLTHGRCRGSCCLSTGMATSGFHALRSAHLRIRRRRPGRPGSAAFFAVRWCWWAPPPSASAMPYHPAWRRRGRRRSACPAHCRAAR